jgi:hypothetical protein
MREITSHIVNPVNDKLSIRVIDQPGAGGANHEYRIVTIDQMNNRHWHLSFQNGAIAEFGVNGITQEALLAIVADRLESFQNGPFACRENEVALEKVQEAMEALQSRTKARMERGVEGRSVA